MSDSGERLNGIERRPQLKIDRFVSYHTLLIIQKLKVGVTGGSSCDTLRVAK